MASIEEVYRELIDEISGIEHAMQPGELDRVRKLAMEHGLSEEDCKAIEDDEIKNIELEKIRYSIGKEIEALYYTPSNETIKTRLNRLKAFAEANGIMDFEIIHDRVFRAMRSGVF